MKKSIFGLLAIVIAIIGLSFTKINTKTTIDRYWYDYNGSTFVAESGNPKASASTSCDELGSNFCVKGFDQQPSDPNTATPQVDIRKQ